MFEDSKGIEFKPFEENIKVLGNLEGAIMEALWKLKASDVKSIHKEVIKEHKVAITTVAIVLDRLYQKGLVERELKKGKGVYYEYSPCLSKPQFEITVVRSFFKGLLQTFGESAVSHIIEDMEIRNEEALKEVKHYFEKMKKD